MQSAYNFSSETFVIISYLVNTYTFREITELFIRKLPDAYVVIRMMYMFEIFVIILYLRTFREITELLKEITGRTTFVYIQL